MDSIILFYVGTFFSSFGISIGAPSESQHPAIWNHDGMTGGSLLGIHEHNDDHHHSQLAIGGAETTNLGGKAVRSEEPSQKMYLVHAADLDIQPAYENSVNPFLSHIEQGWKLKPVRHRYMHKKILQTSAMSPQQQQKMASINSYADELFGPLPVDPQKPHFMDSTEAADAAAEDNKAFGDEEKDLRDMLHVLFSPDY